MVIQEDRALLVFLVSLSLPVLLPGCEHEETPLKTIHIVSYYEHELRFAGITMTMPVELEQYDQKFTSYTVFWNIDSKKKVLVAPKLVSYATICPKIDIVPFVWRGDYLVRDLLHIILFVGTVLLVNIARIYLMTVWLTKGIPWRYAHDNEVAFVEKPHKLKWPAPIKLLRLNYCDVL